MHLEIELEPTGQDLTSLPLHYNRVVQGLIYSQVQARHCYLHDRGHPAGNRQFRLFVFSRLFGQVQGVKDGFITFLGNVKFRVGSPIRGFLQDLGQALLNAGEVSLGPSRWRVARVSALADPVFSESRVTFEALSPVTVYSTLVSGSGRKKTYYFHPSENEFKDLLEQNLQRKGQALGIDDSVVRDIRLVSFKVRNHDLKVVYYKDVVVKGWMGQFTLEGHHWMLKLAYDTGIGAKNSQGFGMITPIQ